MKIASRKSTRVRQAKNRTSTKATASRWEFQVRSYRVVAEFSKESLPAYQPSLTVVDLSSEPGGPTAGKPNAVAYFYWPGRTLPAEPSGVHNNTRELHYPLAALGGILQLLQGKKDLFCFYDNDVNDPLSPRAGIEHKDFNRR